MRYYRNQMMNLNNLQPQRPNKRNESGLEFWVGMISGFLQIANFVLNLGQTQNADILKYLQNENQRDLETIKEKLDKLINK